MTKPAVTVRVNEKRRTCPRGATLAFLVRQVLPEADVLIVNGFPENPGYTVRDGDRITLIQKGRVPSASELRTLLAARHSPGVAERARRSVVGIAGLGGLGSAVALSLARTGVGRLILADYDIVEPSNLNRQQYFVKHLGMAKTEAMRELLAEVNPAVRVTTFRRKLTPGNIVGTFRAAEVLVECFDKASDKSWLVGAVRDSLPKAYLILASGVAGFGDSNAIRTWRMGDRTFVVGDLRSAAGPGQGLMAPRVGVAANHQADLAIRLLVSPDRVRYDTIDILDGPA